RNSASKCLGGPRACSTQSRSRPPWPGTNDCDAMKKGAYAVAILALVGCHDDREPPKREPPPPAPQVVKVGSCSSGSPQITDADTKRAFPVTIASFCVDPNGSEKTYGDDAKEPLEGICDLFDGECEVYKGFGVRRVVELRYVDGAGSAATIDIHFSRFATKE